jgi:toxin-antitoxin system PIN domain toxin
MLFVDVNILVYAHRPESPRHSDYRAWLQAASVGDEPVGISDQVLAGFVRVTTHPRIFVDPTPPEVALAFGAALRSSPAGVVVSPAERTWPIFEDLVSKTASKGNAVPDAFLAAMAIEQGATLISADRSFARFPRLMWRHPLGS